MPAPKFKLKAPIPYEQDIQKAILTQLSYHPLVAWCGRINSGAAMLPCGRGKMRPVKFNTIDGCSDIVGQMKVGIFLGVEVKRPPWSKPVVTAKDKHEQDQLDFLLRVTRANGIGFFATSIEQVAAGIARRVGTCVKYHPLSEVNPSFRSPL